ERAVGLREELAEADGASWRVAGVQIARAFLECIVLDGSAWRKMTSKFGDAFALAHQLDFSKAKLFALGQVIGGFVCQIGLAVRSINKRVYYGYVCHGASLLSRFSLCL